MKITYQTVVKDNKVIEEMLLENICCAGMREALLAQEVATVKSEVKTLWLYCPFCRKEIIY